MRSQPPHFLSRIVDLFDDYEEGSERSRTSAPFLREGKNRISLHFDIGGVQSLMDLSEPNRLMLGYTRTMMQFLRFQPKPVHIGVVGLGGGSLPKYCYHHLPETKISVAEISPEIVALRNRFRIPADDRRFHVHCEDGAAFVKRQRATFDVLLIDGFDSAGQPPELCSQEFYSDCRDALMPLGIVVVNICDSARSMLVHRLNRVFQKRVILMDGEDSTNTIAFAGEVTIDPKSPAEAKGQRTFLRKLSSSFT